MIQESITFLNSQGELLHGIVRVPEGTGKFPAVILCHGFNTNKDHELMFGLWDAISRVGFVCLRFDFTGHGESKGSFRDFTISQSIRDVKSAIDTLKASGIVDEKRIAIVAHGIGASVALLVASQESIKALVEISGIARLEDFISSRFSEHQIKEWKRRGFIQFHDFDELSVEILKDAERHDILASTGKLKCPLLIVHGTDDTSIPFENAREIFYHAKVQKTFELIEGADHFFRNQEHREQLYGLIVDFLNVNLRR